jgi:hypothetical protein
MLIDIDEKESKFLTSLLDEIVIQTAFINSVREKLKGVRPPRREKKNTSVTLYKDQVERFAPSELSCNLRDILDLWLTEEEKVE